MLRTVVTKPKETARQLAKEKRMEGEWPIIEQLRNGQANMAVEILFNTYSRRLTRFAQRILRNEALAEEMSQEVFTKILDHPQSFTRYPNVSISTIMFSTLENLCFKVLSHAKTARETPLEGVEVLLKPQRTNPLNVLMWKEIINASRIEVHSLPTNYRTAVAFIYGEEFSYKEVANIVGQPLGTIKSNAHRAKLMLREKLESRLCNTSSQKPR